MTERQLECFLSLARTLNFNETAQRLYLTQPAVSQQIRSLENDLGVTLFLRSRHGVQLTAAGAEFCTDAADFLNHSRAVVQRVRQAGSYEALRTVAYMMPLRRMPEILTAYHKAWPANLVRLKQGDELNRSQSTFYRRHDISVAFGDDDTAENPEYPFTELYRGGFVCILPEGHPLAQKAEITVDDLAHETLYVLVELMYSPMLRRFHSFLEDRHGAAGILIAENFREASTMAGAGFGAAVLPGVMVQGTPGTVVRPFVYSEQFSLGLFAAADAPEDVKDFCRIARELCRAGKGSAVVL